MFLQIGGLIINVSSPKFKSQIASDYSRFLIDDSPSADINIAASFTSDDFQTNGLCVFRTSNWGIYRENTGLKISFSIEPSPNDPYISLLANNDFNNIHISVYSKNIPSYMEQDQVNPLEFPIDELMFINHLGKNEKGILIHAAGVIYDDKGYLFVGCSGAGKSTISKFFMQNGRVTVLSDDRIVIRNINGSYYIFGTPWHGDANIYSNQGAPLKGIYFLEKGPVNTIKDLSFNDKFTRLFKCGFMSFWDKQQMGYNVELFDNILSNVPSRIFYFLPDVSSIDYILDR